MLTGERADTRVAASNSLHHGLLLAEPDSVYSRLSLSGVYFPFLAEAREMTTTLREVANP